MTKGGGYLSSVNLQSGASRPNKWDSKLAHRNQRKQAHKRINRLLRQLLCYR